MSLVLHTERLTLRPLDASDVDIVIEIFTDKEVRRYTGGPLDEDEIRREMPVTIRRGGNGCIGIWCICDKLSGESLGTGALLPMPIDEEDTDWDLVMPGRLPDCDIEVGYFLKPSAWGNGYATEACKRLLETAFTESPLAVVVATFDIGNHASRNVLLKSGFTDRGMRRSYGEESPYFRITREEWLALQ